ncbi:MAG: AMP-binding protein [Chloroflexi bacterium]|nr:AMP-binding protein [Chloroflexota bacterium]
MIDQPKAQQTLGALLVDAASRYGEQPFILCGDERVSYAELLRRAERLAAGLQARGVGHGARVAFMLPNGLDIIELWFALALLGAIGVPVNTAFRGYQLTYLLNDADAPLFVVGAQYLDRLAAVQADVGPVERLIVADAGAPDGGAVASPPALRWPSEPLADVPTAPRASLPAVDYRDPVAILHTSGTTGPSKGVIVCHRHEYILGRNMAVEMGLRGDDVYWCGFPFFHNTALALITLPVLLVGGAVAVVERFSASRFWDEVVRYGCTAFYYLGALLTILLKAPPSARDRQHTLRVGWGLAASGETMQAFEARFGVPVLSGYGSTEANVVCYEPLAERRPGSAGKPHPEFDVRVVDDHDEPVPPGAVGEIVTRPRDPYVMFLGYYQKPEATVAAWRNLWFHTGDAGRFDADGYLYFVDRLKDVIRRRGENISSYEVEYVASQHPAVLECAAVAVPAELGEDEVKLVVVPRPGQSLDPRDLIAFCAERLAYFAVPRYVQLSQALPKTPTDKVEKHRLRAEGVTAATWDRERAGVQLHRA